MQDTEKRRECYFHLYLQCLIPHQCNAETPCSACPGDARRSDWHTLGCKRGDIKDHMLPVVLCQQQGHDLEITYEEWIQQYYDEPQQSQAPIANDVSRQGLEICQNEIKILKTASPTPHSSLLGKFFQVIHMDVRSLDILRGIPVLPAHGRLDVAPLVPLEDCILMITWELLHNPGSQSVHDGWSLHEFFNLLISAGLYQVVTGVRSHSFSTSLFCRSNGLSDSSRFVGDITNRERCPRTY